MKSRGITIFSFYLICISICLFGFNQTLLATELGAESVKIVLVTKNGHKQDDKKSKEQYYKSWKLACDQLGKAMTSGKGVWGFGVFDTFSCYRDKKKIGGAEKDPRWLLEVVDGENEASFTLSLLPDKPVEKDSPKKTHKDAQANKVEVVKYATSPSDYTLQFLADDEWVDLIAYSILDRMPGGMVLTESMVQGEPPVIKVRGPRSGQAKELKFKAPPPPEEIILFKLAWDDESQSWRSSVVGTAKRLSSSLDGEATEKKPKKKRKKKAKATEVTPTEASYQLGPEVAAALKSGALWAQTSEGPAAREKELAAISGEAHNTLDEAGRNGTLGDFLKGKGLVAGLLDSVASGYVGIRYGLQAFREDPLLKKTKMFGLLAEVRGGPLKGLRYYYDKLPKTSASQNGLSTDLEWSRHVLGFSAGFNPGFLVERITIDPKIGLWSFKANLPTSRDQNNNVTSVGEFNLGQTMSLALEFGIEKLSDWYTLRGWYGIDRGISFVKQGGKVTSNRFGADAYFTAGPKIPMFGGSLKTAWLLFYTYETVSLQGAKVGELAAGEIAATGVNYDGAYAGGGIAVSW